MEIYKYPDSNLITELIKRPVLSQDDIEKPVKEIIEQVAQFGDKALKFFSKKFDLNELGELKVSDKEFKSSEQQVDRNLREAISRASENIRKFHKAQLPREIILETTPGVTCRQKALPIENVGLYIPGGTAPLFSTVLMLAIPAMEAGCKNISVCTPADRNGRVHPAILYTCKMLGLDSVFKVGGAQAIAAMAYGTETIPKADKIFGPGNQFVTKAKQLLSIDQVAIDMPAGPSELMVIADQSCPPEFIAADLLSQAEHGVDSQVVLLCKDEQLPQKVMREIEQQMVALNRKEIARKALDNSFCLVLRDDREVMAFANAYAPEHLIIASENYAELSEQVINAGSVFLGNFTPESAGDYASGTNHTLPTNGWARMYSGLNTMAFMKYLTFQEITQEGIDNLGPDIFTMAMAEDLQAHANAVRVRLQQNKTNTK